VDAFVTIRLPALARAAEAETEFKTSVQPIAAATESSDEALLALICEDDKEGLSLLFRRYARIVRGVAHRVLRDTSEADDLVQDIFLLIHRLCRTYDSSKGSARFWILQMTYRRAISRRRYLTSRHFYKAVDIESLAPLLMCDC
jgi:RNA polymerase sigma-70 factor (ECF subfamily)